MADHHDAAGEGAGAETSVSVEGDAAVIVLRGEVDISRGGGLDEAIDDVLARGVANVAIDLAAVTFMGSSGLASLLRAQRLAGESGVTVELRRPSRAVRDLLDMTRLTERFTIVDT